VIVVREKVSRSRIAARLVNGARAGSVPHAPTGASSGPQTSSAPCIGPFALIDWIGRDAPQLFLSFSPLSLLPGFWISHRHRLFKFWGDGTIRPAPASLH
jgi:hypothetical protein